MAIRQRTGLCWDSDLEWLVMLVGCRFFRINVISFGAGLGDVVRSMIYNTPPKTKKHNRKNTKTPFFIGDTSSNGCLFALSWLCCWFMDKSWMTEDIRCIFVQISGTSSSWWVVVEFCDFGAFFSEFQALGWGGHTCVTSNIPCKTEFYFEEASHMLSCGQLCVYDLLLL